MDRTRAQSRYNTWFQRAARIVWRDPSIRFVWMVAKGLAAAVSAYFLLLLGERGMEYVNEVLDVQNGAGDLLRRSLSEAKAAVAVILFLLVLALELIDFLGQLVSRLAELTARLRELTMRFRYDQSPDCRGVPVTTGAPTVSSTQLQRPVSEEPRPISAESVVRSTDRRAG